jgi:CHASE3 domain sensor protein
MDDPHISLKEYIETRLESIKATMEAADKSIALRLDQMNELREQITEERGKYLTRREFEVSEKSIKEDIRSLRESRAELAGKASTWSVVIAGGFALIATLLSIGSLMVATMR